MSYITDGTNVEVPNEEGKFDTSAFFDGVQLTVHLRAGADDSEGQRLGWQPSQGSPWSAPSSYQPSSAGVLSSTDVADGFRTPSRRSYVPYAGRGKARATFAPTTTVKVVRATRKKDGKPQPSTEVALITVTEENANVPYINGRLREQFGDDSLSLCLLDGCQIPDTSSTTGIK